MNSIIETHWGEFLKWCNHCTVKKVYNWVDTKTGLRKTEERLLDDVEPTLQEFWRWYRNFKLEK